MKSKKIIIAIVLLLVFGGLTWFLLQSGQDTPLFDGRDDSLKEDITQEDLDEFEESIRRLQEVESLYYEIERTGPLGGIVAKFWHKGDKIRKEIVSGEARTISLIDKEGDVYNFSLGSNTVTKLEQRAAENVIGYNIIKESKSLLDYDITVVGSEEVNEKECFVVEYTTQYNEEFTVWVWKEYGLIVKSEQEVHTGKITTNVTNVEIKEIADELFTVPEDAEITDDIIFF